MKNAFIIIFKKLKHYDIPIFIIWNITLVYLLFFYSSEKDEVINIVGLDKIIHIILFASLSLSSFWTFTKKDISNYISYTYPLIFAISSELIQHHFIQGRSGDILDLIADIIGIILGIKIARLIDRMLV